MSNTLPSPGAQTNQLPLGKKYGSMSEIAQDYCNGVFEDNIVSRTSSGSKSRCSRDNATVIVAGKSTIDKNSSAKSCLVMVENSSKVMDTTMSKGIHGVKVSTIKRSQLHGTTFADDSNIDNSVLAGVPLAALCRNKITDCRIAGHVYVGDSTLRSRRRSRYSHH